MQAIYESNSNDEVVTWLKDNQFLRQKPPKCVADKCEKKQMKWSKKNNSDGYIWRCSKCGKSRSIRDKSFFR